MSNLEQFGNVAQPLTLQPQPDTAGQISPVFGMAESNEFFCTPGGRAYASVVVGEHVETWALKSRGFQEWLSRHFYESEGKTPTTQKLNEALRLLEGKAKFEGDTHEVHIRVAEDAQTGDIYIDLCDRDWRVVKVTREGWSVLPGGDAPVKFERRRGMLALPEPQRGGSVQELRPFVNLASEEDWMLLAAWAVAALRPRGPYPILALHGEQGSAKSTTARILCSLIDPNQAPLRSQNRSMRNFMIAATNKWLFTLDNLSQLTAEQSDFLCCLSTGGGYGVRELRTDTEEQIFDAQRPIILTGIEEVATRGDLLDRALVLYLPPISADRRRAEMELKREFEQARPRILGALLGAVSTALSKVETVELTERPRLADFAEWATAAESAFTTTPGAFMVAFGGNRVEANEIVLDSSPVGVAVLAYMQRHEVRVLTAGRLLEELNAVVKPEVRRRKGWPATARGMSGALRRITTSLLAAGVSVEMDIREGGTGRRLIRLESVAAISSPPSPAPPAGDGSSVSARESSPAPSPSKSPEIEAGCGGDGCDDTDGLSPDEFNERAAIYEYDGGLTREEADQRIKRQLARPSKPTLSTFVRSEGGMRAGFSGLDGELRRLSNKETGSSRLVNNKSGQRIEEVMEAANVEGYRDAGGNRFESPSDFLEAVEMDARKLRRYYHPDTEVTF
jgi:hypothetical protein